HYRPLLNWIIQRKFSYHDQARQYLEFPLSIARPQSPFPHQQEGLGAWLKEKKRGVVVLPTGAGKTYLALMAMAETGRSTLIVSPTLDLMNQWYDLLIAAFQQEIGILGGGYHEIKPITVTTYDSTYIHMGKMGNRFGLLIFDECHHLPGQAYSVSAQWSLAPFRLGLTATPERGDGLDKSYPELIGPIVYRKEIHQLAGNYLASYQTRQLFVELSEAERKEYQHHREVYLQFLRSRNISMSSPKGWQRFIMESASDSQGRNAFLSYRRQKELASAAPAKIRLFEELLQKHTQDQILIFTNENQTVYQLSKQFLIPSITHQTKTKERKLILDRFNEGIYPVIVTSKVLNEGINVPKANIAIVLSGSGSTREHVQRLGRVLRKLENKKAILYEVVTRDTNEEFVSDRRREHTAYQQTEAQE
ncbi:MAG: DEAD/DEAH box helicase, partial [Planctomycetota bacterium]